VITFGYYPPKQNPMLFTPPLNTLRVSYALLAYAYGLE
jgi:hypothetical protein